MYHSHGDQKDCDKALGVVAVRCNQFGGGCRDPLFRHSCSGVRADEDIFACFATVFPFGIFFNRTWRLRRDFRLWIVFAGLLALHVAVLVKCFLFQSVFSPRNWTALVLVDAVILEVTASQLVSKLSTRP